MKNIKNVSLLFVSFLLLTPHLGCGMKKIATKSTAQIFHEALPLMDAEDDVELAQQASLGGLKMLDGLYLQNPKDPTVLILLTHAYAGYAFGFTENDVLKYKGSDPEKYEEAVTRAKRFYGRAKKYGLELLSLNSKFASAVDGTLQDYEQSLKGFGERDTEKLFWTGFAWANDLNYNKDSIASVAELPRIEALMQRVVDLNEGYNHGNAHLFFGVFYGSRPPMLGGNPEKSKQHFDKAIAINNGKCLMALVAKAQFYAVQTQDAALFTRLLNDVLQADPMAMPSQVLVNKLAQQRARYLLKKKSLFFNK